MGFNKLSTELILLIVRNFCLHCRSIGSLDPEPPRDALDRHALWSLCLTSRRLRDVSQVVLYHEFVSTARGHAQLASFLRAVTASHSLAESVKRISISSYVLSAPARPGTFICWTHPWTAISFVAARLPNLEHYSLALRGRQSVHSLYCPCVLNVDVGGCRQSPQALAPSSSTGGCTHPFVDLLCNRGLGDCQEIPFIRKLTIRMSNIASQIPSMDMCMSPRLRIETLHVVQGRMGPADLRRLLASCTGLRNFTYEADNPPGPEFVGYCTFFMAEDHQFQPSAVSEGLAPHRETLVSLHLDLRARAYFSDHNVPIASLKDFVALESLFLNWTAVSSRQDDEDASIDRLPQMLPPNLVSLQLVGCHFLPLAPFARMLLALTDAIAQGKFHKLKRIRCDSRLFLGPEDAQADDLASLKEFAVVGRFPALGVDFGYDNPPMRAPEFRQNHNLSLLSGLAQEMPLPEDDEDDDL